MNEFNRNDFDTINGRSTMADELDKIKAMLTFMADTTDLLLTSTMRERQQPMKDTPYGMHLLFMELISKLDKACKTTDN
ncbi:MAG: hypothetical protein HQL06_13990 [Nitrospirae bacterium]|nr:hypothetical protein [Nitrospirota bacterium]